jgi:alkanesulfonate monooxygenase SsuD/methylene tetrahydromethanopterin reductase-like flavin-dependent oxidoreductase (luciferase family)
MSTRHSRELFRKPNSPKSEEIRYGSPWLQTLQRRAIAWRFDRCVEQAEQAGFSFAMISDHFHPWTERQGNRVLSGRCSVPSPGDGNALRSAPQ